MDWIGRGGGVLTIDISPPGPSDVSRPQPAPVERGEETGERKGGQKGEGGDEMIGPIQTF